MRHVALGWVFTALGLLAMSAHATDTVYYYSSDTLHSEVVVTDQNRNVVERTHYAPYGVVLNRDLRDGPGYTGHEEDPETGLVYMQQRYYCPECGRFLSVDPVQADGNGGSFNRYAYANDNPYRYTDPDGRESGAGYATGEYTVALPPSSPEARDVALTMVGMAPVVGDVQNVVDAYNNPSVFDIAVAVVGLVPEAGAAVADLAKVAKVAEAAKDVERGAADVAKGAGKETGSYTNLHESGKTYSGKGSRVRSQVSARRVEKETGDKHIATDWTSASNERSAFKQESGRIDTNGGPGSGNNYNKIASPGKKMCHQDEDC